MAVTVVLSLWRFFRVPIEDRLATDDTSEAPAHSQCDLPDSEQVGIEHDEVRASLPFKGTDPLFLNRSVALLIVKAQGFFACSASRDVIGHRPTWQGGASRQWPCRGMDTD